MAWYTLAMSQKKRPGPKRSTVRHTRAIQVDRIKRPTVAPPDEKTKEVLTEVIHPASYNQVAAFWDAGLRERTLTLPVMVALVLSAIWRQMGSVREAVRTLNREGMLWTAPLGVSRKAVSDRLRTLPAHLFHSVLMEVLPRMHERWEKRGRPIPAAIARARQHFPAILVLDGSTLDGLLRKVGLLREGEGPILAGRMAALLDVASQLPRRIWYEEDSQAHDQRFWERAIESLERGTLLLMDLGFTNYPIFDRLVERGVFFLTRAKKNAVYQTVRVLGKGEHYCDQIILLGARGNQCAHPLRLVEVKHEGTWYRYLTSVVDPKMLCVEDVVALYWQRWRVEDAFKVVKRLLGLAYFWTGASNGIQLQVWSTWLLYAALVDLTDAVAEKLEVPFQRVSMEMVYRGLYHFTQAYHRGQAQDPVAYLADDANKDLGVLKRKRGPTPSDLLHLTVSPTA